MIVWIPREPWLAGDLLEVDRIVHAAEDRGGEVDIRCDPDLSMAVSLRYQRLSPVRNVASSTPGFGAVLRTHRGLHDVSKPLVRADLDHAWDTWQWTLRLDATASAEAQLAALLHDVERLESEPDVRIEHRAAHYELFKDAHARRGATLARMLVAGGRWNVDRVGALIRDHERGGDAPELKLLADADALSFFALNSPGYLRWFGPEQTARKVSYTLARMSDRARPWLAEMRLPTLVGEAIGL